MKKKFTYRSGQRVWRSKGSLPIEQIQTEEEAKEEENPSKLYSLPICRVQFFL